MLKIVNNAGLVLELATDEVITVEKNNILFNDSDDLFQDLSYSAKAPFTDNNKAFFNLAHLVETPNSYYDIAVTCHVEGVPIGAGNIHFRIGQEAFEFNLEANYAAVNTLIKDIRLTEIRTADALTLTTAATMEALMLDTVQNPDRYPYIFFPVKNPSFADPVSGSAKYDFVNYFDSSTQTFKAVSPSGTITSWAFAIVPFFKLTYILRQVLLYLGFAADGGFFTDPAFKNTCVYTRQCVDVSLSAGVITYYLHQSMRYMPNMLISDFIKQLRERLHLIIDFDAATGVATVETLGSLLRSDDVFDLTPYIGTEMEQEVPDKTGYSVTLKSDTQDAKFKVTTGDEDTFPPLYQLTSGDGSTTAELECSTTNIEDLSSPGVIGNRYCIVDQTMTGNSWVLGIPDDIAPTDKYDPTTVNNWPLRFMRFTGYIAMTAGGHYPCSEPVDLDQKDVDYYRFINDSKRLIGPGMLPPVALANMKTTRKYGFRAEGLNYTYCLLEKNSVDLDMNSEIIPAQLYLRTINSDINTRVTIQTINNPIIYPYVFGYIKAYFDNSVNGLEKLSLQVVATGAGIGHNTYQVDPIVIPTTPKGTGGKAVPIVLINIVGVSDGSKLTAEIRIAQPAPKYMEYKGVVYNFTWSGSYWYVAINMSENTLLSRSDFYWIKF